MRASRILLAVLSITSLTGCASVITGTARSVEAPGAVVHQPVTSNLDVKSTRVSGRATVKAGQEALGRNSALRSALAAAQADVLVAPTYTIERDASNLTVTVTGYPATYKDFRNATAADLELLNAAAADKATAANGDAGPLVAPGSSAARVLLGTTLLVLLITLTAGLAAGG